MSLRVLIRGGGDLGSGVALRLLRCGAQVVVTELEKPLVVRRAAAYANAVYEGICKVEETRGVLCGSYDELNAVITRGEVGVLIDPASEIKAELLPHVLVDARMTKQAPEVYKNSAPLVVGLGPGFIAGVHSHAVIETKRGATLGRVYWTGTAETDTEIPETILGTGNQRVLRAPGSGVIKDLVRIGDLVIAGQKLAVVDGKVVEAEFDGVVRGLIADGFPVIEGMKIGDLDPRRDPRLCYIVSDKALAVGGGVLEAILSRADIRTNLCN